MTKKYFLYTRVSVSDQYDVSLDTQEKVLQEVGRERGIQDILPIKESKSGGGKTKRDLFDDMVDQLEKDSQKSFLERSFGGVLFYKLDRLARNSFDFHRIEALVMKGYKFISGTEIIENTPTGRLLLRVLASFAIYEQERASSRKIISMVENVFNQQFGKLGGSIHFGYSHKNQKILVHDQEKQIVREIYKLYSDGKTYAEIACDINNKYLHPKKKGKGYLEGYIMDKKFKNIASLVENIILNDHFIKYNGVVERTINITDELVLKHIQYLKERNVTSFDEDSLFVGNSLAIDIYLDDVAIVEEPLYCAVQRKHVEKKENPPLFDNILFFKDTTGEHGVYSGLTKGWYYYTSKGNKKDSISEHKIIKMIHEKGLLSNIAKIKTIESQIIAIFDEVSKSYFAKDIQRCLFKEQFYTEKIDKLETGKQTEKSPDKLQTLNSTINGHKDLLGQITTHKNNLEKNINILQNQFLNLFSKDSFKKDGDRETYNLKYEAIFEKIVMESKTITFYPHLFIQKVLGYKKKSVRV